MSSYSIKIPLTVKGELSLGDLRWLHETFGPSYDEMLQQGIKLEQVKRTARWVQATKKWDVKDDSHVVIFFRLKEDFVIAALRYNVNTL